MKIKLLEFSCKRCGHKWYPRKPEMPLRCGKCRSPYWNRERVIPTDSVPVQKKENEENKKSIRDQFKKRGRTRLQ